MFISSFPLPLQEDQVHLNEERTESKGKSGGAISEINQLTLQGF